MTDNQSAVIASWTVTVIVIIVGALLTYRLWRQLIQQEMELMQFKIIFSGLRARDNQTLGKLIEMDRLAATEADVERERELKVVPQHQNKKVNTNKLECPERTMQDHREHPLRASAGND